MTVTFTTYNPLLFVKPRPRLKLDNKFGYCRRCRVTMSLDFGACTVCGRPLSKL